MGSFGLLSFGQLRLLTAVRSTTILHVNFETGGYDMPDCIVPGCRRNAPNNLSIRLRPPDTSAIWSPNANAYVCDVHARNGARITVVFEPTDTKRVETRVYGASEPAVRRTAIRH
jgi:hypothetical protein